MTRPIGSGFFSGGAAPEPGSMIKVCAQVPRSLHENFITVMPQKGAIAWMMRASMEAVINILAEEPALRFRLEQALRARLREAPETEFERLLKESMEDDDDGQPAE